MCREIILHIPRRFDYRVIHGLYWYYDLLAQPMENVWDECKKDGFEQF